MRTLGVLLAALLMASATVRGEDFVTFNRVADLKLDEPRSLGRTCRIRGIVNHESALHEGLYFISPTEMPYRAGIPVMISKIDEELEIGDEIWVKGETTNLVGRVGIAAEAAARISSIPPNFARTFKYSNLRKGLVDWRRVKSQGVVQRIGAGPIFKVLTIMTNAGVIYVRTTGLQDDDRYVGREVALSGCVIPVYSAEGVVLGRCIELSNTADIELVDPKKPSRVILPVAPAVLGVAFLWALVALIRARRERLKMSVIMEERKRMAKDLHDTIEQHLASVRLLISGAMNRQNLDPGVRDTLTKASEVLANAKLEVRDAVMNLRNDEALSKSPSVVLKELAREINSTGMVRVRTLLRGLPEHLPASQYQDLLFIVREALTNAIKHGHAKTIVFASDPGWRLRILNDGEPFDETKALGPAAGHYGLSGMRERAARSGFEIAFTHSGRWTSIEIKNAE